MNRWWCRGYPPEKPPGQGGSRCSTSLSDLPEEALSVSRVSRGVDRLGVTFDDSTLVANAGLLVVATLSARLGIADIADRLICLAGGVGGARPGRKVLTLVHAMVAGASHIDHADMLRAGSTARV